MAFKKTNIDRQLIKPARRGFTESSPPPATSSVCDSASGTSPRMRTSRRSTTVLKRGCEPSPTTALGDASPVLPVRCRGHVSKEMEENTMSQYLCEKKGSKKEKKTRKRYSKASASPPSSTKQATQHNVRVPRARNNLLGSDISCCSSYSSPQCAHLPRKRQDSLCCSLSSALSPISEDPKKSSIVLGCEDGESPRFKKLTRNSLRRPSVKRDIIFGKHSIGAASSRYVGRNEQRRRLSDSQARRQLIGKSVLDILDETDDESSMDDSSITAEECVTERSAWRTKIPASPPFACRRLASPTSPTTATRLLRIMNDSSITAEECMERNARPARPPFSYRRRASMSPTTATWLSRTP